MKNYEVKYLAKYYKQNGLCFYCKKPLNNSGQLAHRVIKSKANLKKYGEEIINHEMNLRLTCPACNSRAIIEHKTERKKKLIEKIQNEIEK